MQIHIRFLAVSAVVLRGGSFNVALREITTKAFGKSGHTTLTTRCIHTYLLRNQLRNHLAQGIHIELHASLGYVMLTFTPARNTRHVVHVNDLLKRPPTRDMRHNQSYTIMTMRCKS